MRIPLRLATRSRAAITALLFIVAAGAVDPARALTLYAVAASGDLYTVDTVALTTAHIGPLGFVPPNISEGGAFVGLDVNPANGKLYVSNDGNGGINTVDTSSGATTPVSTVTSPTTQITQNLAFSPAGVLYGAESASLYTIDVGTGATNFIGFHAYDINGLAFAPNGNLYAVVGGGGAITRIDPLTDAFTFVAGSSPCWVGLAAASDGYLYCTGQTAASPLYKVDPTTGATTFLFNTNLNIGDMAEQVAPAGPTSADQCKKDGWKSFTNPSFKNQGPCVSAVVSNRGGH